MAKISEIVQYSKLNPETDYAKTAMKHIQSGAFDTQAQKEGYDLSWAGRPALQSTPTQGNSKVGIEGNLFSSMAGGDKTEKPLTPEYKAILQKEDPETLQQPQRSQFDTDANYQKAVTRFNNLGHWATEQKDYTKPLTQGAGQVLDAATQSEQNFGKDISQAGYLLFGGQKNIDETTQQYLDNGDRLTQLAKKQTDTAAKQKYANMAIEMYKDAQKVGGQVIGNVRTPEQIVGDALGTAADIAAVGDYSGIAKSAGIVSKPVTSIAQGAIQGATKGAIQGGAYGLTKGGAGALSENKGIKDVAVDALKGGALGAAAGGVIGGVTGGFSAFNQGKPLTSPKMQLKPQTIDHTINDIVGYKDAMTPDTLQSTHPDIAEKIRNTDLSKVKNFDELEKALKSNLTPDEFAIAKSDISRTVETMKMTEPIANKQGLSQFEKSPDDAIKAVTPNLKGKKLVGAYTSDFGEGATKGGLVTKQAAPISDETKRIATNLQDVLTSKNNIDNLHNLGAAMDDTEAKLVPILQDSNISVDNEKLFGQLEQARTSMPKEFQAIKENKKLFNSVVDFAQEQLNNSDGSLEATRNARIAFDTQAKTEFPSAYNQGGFIDTSKPAGRAIKMVRDAINNAMYNSAGEDSMLKSLIGREADIFKAVQVVGQKAAANEGKNAIVQFIQAHPYWDTIIGTLGVEAGLKKIITGKFF